MSSYEKWSLAITIAGVVVGILVLVVYALQLREMRASVVAAEKAAYAAQKNADVLIASQRAQLALKPHGNPSQELLEQEVQRIRVALINKGTTAAYDLVYESWIEILPFPFDDFTSAADYFRSTEPSALYPDHIPLVLNMPIRRGLTAQQRIDLMSLRQYACVRVRVSYRDAFKALRYANFGYYIVREGFGILPKYNDAD